VESYLFGSDQGRLLRKKVRKDWAFSVSAEIAADWPPSLVLPDESVSFQRR
jgi:hypothetical protein